MDGVLANFHQALFDLYSIKVDQYELIAKPPFSYDIHNWVSAVLKLKISEAGMWLNIDDAAVNRKFWANIAPYPWFWDVWSLCNQLADEVIISTSPGHHHAAFSQKREWLKKWLPDAKRIMMGADKHLMAKPNHILLDDSEHNCAEFLRHGGKAVIFPQLWNSGFQIRDWRDKLHHIESELKNQIKRMDAI